MLDKMDLIYGQMIMISKSSSRMRMAFTHLQDIKKSLPKFTG